jgi:hypothetical protein
VPDALTIIRDSQDVQDVAGLIVVSNRRNVRHHPLLRFGAAPVDVAVYAITMRRTATMVDAFEHVESLSHVARAPDCVGLSVRRQG